MAGKTCVTALAFPIMLMLLSFGLSAQDGTVTFSRTYDFSHGYESGRSVIELNDGYLVCASGYATEYDGWSALKIMKTDFEGNIAWVKMYGQEKKGFTSGWYGSMTKIDNGFFLAAGIMDSGNVDSKGVIYRFDENCDTIWTKRFDKPGFSFFTNARQTSDKGFSIVGVQYISGKRNYWLVKTDSSGITLLDTVMPGTGYASNIEIATDRGYIIGGAGGDFLSSVRLVKTDSLGKVEWSRNYFSGNQHGCYGGAGLASDGGFYIWGCSDTLINPNDFYVTPVVAKLDSFGNQVWVNYYNSPNQLLATVNQVKELPNGNILLLGERDDGNPLLASGGWIILMDSSGTTIWEKIHATTEDSSFLLGTNSANDGIMTLDGGLLITGYGFTDIDPGPIYNGTQDIWLLKLDSLGNWYAPADTDTCPPPCDTVGMGEIGTLAATLYPNPATNTLTIELPGGGEGRLTLYNLLGQEVFGTATHGHQTTVGLSLPPGVYLYRITQGTQHANGKLLVE